MKGNWQKTTQISKPALSSLERHQDSQTSQYTSILQLESRKQNAPSLPWKFSTKSKFHSSGMLMLHICTYIHDKMYFNSFTPCTCKPESTLCKYQAKNIYVIYRLVYTEKHFYALSLESMVCSPSPSIQDLGQLFSQYGSPSR